jgi:hypothetical protein
MIKALIEVGIKGNLLNLKTTYKKTYSQQIIMLNGNKFKAFPLRSGARKGCPLSPSLSALYWKSKLMP